MCRITLRPTFGGLDSVGPVLFDIFDGVEGPYDHEYYEVELALLEAKIDGLDLLASVRDVASRPG